MKRTMLPIAILAPVLVALGLAGWNVRPGLDAMERLDDTLLASTVGTNPSYRPINGGDACSANNLGGTPQDPQVAAYACAGVPGAECVICDGIAIISGTTQGSPTGTVQPSGGAPLGCGGMDKWIGECIHPGGVYSCQPRQPTFNKCNGTYGPFTDQLGGVS